MKFKMSKSTAQGGRYYQEDRLIVYWVPDEGYLLAVFDGHGGAECAEYCANRLIPLYHEVRNSLLVASFEAVVKKVFYKLNESTQHMGSGCAASIALIPKNGKEVIVGVLGDSPVLVKQENGDLWLSPEHNVRSNPSEVEAAKERGGWVSGGYLYSTYSGGGLQMSRALGDVSLDRVLNREPEVFRLPIGAGSFVLVATDGLLDPTHSTKPAEEIAKLIASYADAGDLVKHALEIPTNDNVTAILVELSEGE